MTMTEAPHPPSDPRLRVLIAGGGVAALETAFALHALAGGRVTTRVVAPNHEFVDRLRTIGDPPQDARGERYPLAPLVAQAGAELVPVALEEVDTQRRMIRASNGEVYPYDALVLATGAARLPRFAHATTLEEAHLDDLARGLTEDIDQDRVRRLAIVVPAPAVWPLPAYELALMVSERSWDLRKPVEILLLTPERRPLEIFGERASERLAALLAEQQVEVITSAVSDVPSHHLVMAHPSERVIEVDRIVAMPQLRGGHIPGLPADGGGFVPVDDFGRVRGTKRVWAAGEVTDFPIKQGGVAAGLADVVADGVAALAGVRVTVRPFAPALRAILRTGGGPRYLYGRPAWPSAHVESELSEHPLDADEDQLHARHLIPRLRRLRTAGVGI